MDMSPSKVWMVTRGRAAAAAICLETSLTDNKILVFISRLNPVTDTDAVNRRRCRCVSLSHSVP